MFEEVQAKALKRALAEQLDESMEAAKLTKLEMAKKMATSRSQLDRVLPGRSVSYVVHFESPLAATSKRGLLGRRI